MTREAGGFLVSTAEGLAGQIATMLTHAIGQTKRACGEDSAAFFAATESMAAVHNLKDSLLAWRRALMRADRRRRAEAGEGGVRTQ